MQVKINREIKDYKESMFMGLSMRQCIYSVLAIATAVALYFLLKPVLSIETLSWVCILGAFPFVLLGFVNYNKMNAEQLFRAWLRTEVLEPKKLKYIPSNYYYAAVEDSIKKNRKEAIKHSGKKAEKT